MNVLSLLRNLYGLLWIAVSLVLLVPTGVAQLNGERSPKMRDVTVDDAVSMVRLAASDYFEGVSIKGHVAQFSPDGKHFVLVLRRGVIADNANEYSIYLFHSSQALHSPRAKLLARMKSSSNDAAIQEVRWSGSGRYITFIGTTHRGTQIFRVNVSTKRLEQLTHHSTPIINYATSKNEHHIVFLAETAQSRRPAIKPVSQTGISITDQSLFSLLKGETSSDPVRREIFVQSSDIERRVKIRLPLNGRALWLSPDGRSVVVAPNVKIDQLPREWSGYNYPGGAWAQSMFNSGVGSQLSPFVRYFSIDI